MGPPRPIRKPKDSRRIIQSFDAGCRLPPDEEEGRNSTPTRCPQASSSTPSSLCSSRTLSFSLRLFLSSSLSFSYHGSPFLFLSFFQCINFGQAYQSAPSPQWQATNSTRLCSSPSSRAWATRHQRPLSSSPLRLLTLKGLLASPTTSPIIT